MLVSYLDAASSVLGNVAWNHASVLFLIQPAFHLWSLQMNAFPARNLQISHQKGQTPAAILLQDILTRSAGFKQGSVQQMCFETISWKGPLHAAGNASAGGCLSLSPALSLVAENVTSWRHAEHINARKWRKVVVVYPHYDITLVTTTLHEWCTHGQKVPFVEHGNACVAEDILIQKESLADMPPATEAVGSLRRFVDISVPRNIASNISSLESAVVYNVDDLKEVVAANIEERQKAAAEARELLREEQQMFEGWRDSLATVPTIKALRNKVGCPSLPVSGQICLDVFS